MSARRNRNIAGRCSLGGLESPWFGELGEPRKEGIVTIKGPTWHLFYILYDFRQ